MLTARLTRARERTVGPDHRTRQLEAASGLREGTGLSTGPLAAGSCAELPRPRRLLGCVLALAVLLTGACSSGSGRRPASGAPGSTSRRWSAAPTTYLAQAETSVPQLAAVRSLLVSVDGRTVLERYVDGGPDETHHVYSVTKSVVSTLVGIAVDEGLLDGVDSTLAELLPRERDAMTPRVAGVTLRQLLTMTSGIADEADGGAPWDPSQPDAVRTILSSGSVEEPGRSWRYSNAATHLLTAVLAEATGGSVLDFARRVLFDPLGIRTRPAYEGTERMRVLGPSPAWSPAFRRAGFAWATDRQGVHVGGLTLKLTARDLLRFGQLHLDGGRWDGAAAGPGRLGGGGRPARRAADRRRGRSATATSGGSLELDGHDAFAASGAFGQAVVVVPDRRLVAVMTAADDVRVPMQGVQLVPYLTEVVLPLLE